MCQCNNDNCIWYDLTNYSNQMIQDGAEHRSEIWLPHVSSIIITGNAPRKSWEGELKDCFLKLMASRIKEKWQISFCTPDII